MDREDTPATDHVLGDRYRLQHRIARGGMASIWRAEHVVLRRPVAVKLLHAISYEPSETIDQFLREARVAASVRHRNVVQIVDFGTTPEGRPFMVMELLEGRSLAARLADPTGLALDETIRLVARVLAGLGAVHDAGIVHRDMKPENVFLVREGDSEYPKVIDFGISRASRDREGGAVERGIVGTPRSMSPEQARGMPDLDARTDVWSVGAMLYELLTGAPPFRAASAGERIVAVLTSAPVALASRRPDLPRPLVAVVERAMARERVDRYADANELRRALLLAAREIVGEATGSHPIARAVDSFTPMFDREAVARSLRELDAARGERNGGPEEPAAEVASPDHTEADAEAEADDGAEAEEPDIEPTTRIARPKRRLRAGHLAILAGAAAAVLAVALAWWS